MTQQSIDWYIVQRETGQCDILSDDQVAENQLSNSSKSESAEYQQFQTWGPFASEGEAIAKRVGLIRAGKCKPFMG